ncbi:hypothetical protein GGI20_002024 [Coemansia sp. BCRC 34301]|nr:hypothetical protein GGI20_002024 [Coemansia sp. BCRC 34301]
MPLEPFKVPETRLLAISELVVQVTLTFRTDEDEELHYRYDQDDELQALVQTAVVSLVNCGYTTGIAKGPGFLLHQVRKKWPIGRRYIFTKDGEPMQSSLHKYFFQLEFTDDGAEQRQSEEAPPVIEIAELRGVAMSPSASSYNGSIIEGLDSVMLPPMAAIFGHGSPSLHGSEFYGHRRSGSGNSSNYSASLHRPHSPYLGHREKRPRSSSSHYSLRDNTGTLDRLSHSNNGGSLVRHSNLYQDATSASEHYRNAKASAAASTATTAGPSSVSQYVQYYAPRHSAIEQPRNRASEGKDISGMKTAESLSPVTVSMRTRSVSRSSVGSASGSVQTMQSVSDIQAPAITASQQRRVSSDGHGNSGDMPPTNGQVRLGRTSWYRSLHGISPLSRQPKSLSSEAEFVDTGAIGPIDVRKTGSNESRTLRVAGIAPPSSRAKDSSEPSRLGGMASKIKRKLLTPMHLRRNKDRRSSPSHPASAAEGDSDVDTGDFTGPESEEGSEAEGRLGQAGSASSVGVGRLSAEHSRAANAGTSTMRSLSTSVSPSAQATPPGISRPDMPPPSTRPPPRPESRGQGELSSIPTAVKNALLRRLRSPLGGRPDKSASTVSVRDKISAFNSLSVEPDNTPTKQPTSSATSRASSVAGDLPPVGLTARARMGTPTGFISIAIPVSATSSSFTGGVSGGGLRSHSRASSVRSVGARPASPALSHASNVSTRIQDTINALERAAAGSASTPPSRRLDASLDCIRGGGVTGSAKRVATGSVDALDSFASPTKRQRAPSMVTRLQSRAAESSGTNGSSASGTSGSRLGPLDMVKNMVRRNTGR